MFSSSVFGVLFVLAFVATTAFAFPSPTTNSTIVKLISIDDISKLKDLPQGSKLIPLRNARNTKGTITYYIGTRTGNDELVSQAADSQTWNEARNVQLRLEYPAYGTGAAITYVEVNVNQSSLDGEAYLVSGGPGSRSIVLVVIAYNTYWFSYNFNLYGCP